MKITSCLIVFTGLFFIPLLSVAQRADNYRPQNTAIILDHSNLPIIFIETGGQMILKDKRITAKMKIINDVNRGRNYSDTISYPSQRIDYDGYIGIRYRGNSSFRLSDKKPYSIHLITDSIERGGKKRKESLLGMPAHNNWALLSLYIDKSMIREALTFTLAQQYFDYCPRVRYCEVVLDSIYYGVYLLIERVKRGDCRLNFPKAGEDGDALTGGYLVEIDRNDSPCYTSQYHPVSINGYAYTDKNVYFQYKEPEYSDMTEDQLQYINHQIDVFETSLKSSNFKDPLEGYRKYIDVNSFIDYQLTQEVTNNCDAYRLSTNMYKYRDSIDPRFKLTIWDFDRAWGKSRNIGYMTDVWAYQDNQFLTTNDDIFIPFWWGRLMEDESYVQALRERWAEYRKGSYSDAHIENVIDSLSEVLSAEGALERNSKAWPQWGVYKYPEYYTADSFEDEIEWLKDWIRKRLKWMDDQLLDAPSYIYSPETIENEKEYYYTLEGNIFNEPQKGFNIIKNSSGKYKKIIRNR